MPNIVTDYGQQFIAGCFMGLYESPSSVWIGLGNTEPGQAVDGTQFAASSEVQAADYARVQVATGAGNWVLNSSGFIVNLSKIFIGATASDWGVVNYFVLLDAPSAGNVYCYSQVQNPQRVPSGSALAIPAGAILLLTGSLLPPIAI